MVMKSHSSQIQLFPTETPLIHCAIHDKFEQEGVYSCVECRHQYHHTQEAIVNYNHIVTQVYERNAIPNKPVAHTLDDVPFCPMCLHDW